MYIYFNFGNVNKHKQTGIEAANGTFSYYREGK